VNRQRPLDSSLLPPAKEEASLRRGGRAWVEACPCEVRMEGGFFKSFWNRKESAALRERRIFPVGQEEANRKRKGKTS
jgi:hypothetical protein